MKICNGTVVRLSLSFWPSMFRPTASGRMWHLRIAAAFAITGYILVLCQGQSPTADREEHWRQDLKFFADEFASHQLDFAKLYRKPEFDAEITSLEAEVGRLSDAEITLRLMRLVASANVGHTLVNLPLFKLGFDRLPLTLYWYSDGLAVVAAAPAYSDALGTRVLRIGSRTPEQLAAAVAPYIAHENDVWLKHQCGGYLTSTPILRQLGVAGADGRVEFTLAKPGGQPFAITVTPAGPLVVRDQVRALDGLRVPTALSRKQLASYYWYEYLTDSQTLYLQYNNCQDDPKLSFRDFARELFVFADSHPVQRVVVDLRFNGGGNSLVIYPLVAGLKARNALRSHLYVLIGPATFSSAQDNAIELRRDCAAKLVGEPTGEKPNSYGEVREFTLPNSKLKVRYTTAFERLIKDKDPLALEPDVHVPSTLADALAGRDPVLEVALRNSTRP